MRENLPLKPDIGVEHCEGHGKIIGMVGFLLFSSISSRFGSPTKGKGTKNLHNYILSMGFELECITGGGETSSHI